MIRRFLIIFSILFAFSVIIINSKIFTARFEAVNLLNSTYLKGYYNISRLIVTKFNRSTSVLNADFELLADIDAYNYFLMRVESYFKKRAGLNYNKHFYSVSIPGTPCSGFETFWKFAMKGFNGTNFPPYEMENDGENCVILKVNCRSAKPECILFNMNFFHY